MIIEAVTQPIKYQWPEGEILLEPGKPIQVDPNRGLKVLTRCGVKVREIKPQWLEAWEELAQATFGIEKNDPRFMPVLDSLKECDQAFEQGDWIQFKQAAAAVQRLVKEGQRGRNG